MEICNTIQPIPDDADVRACIEQFDAQGKLVVRTYGPSPTELQEAHDNGKCDAFCGICYDEAMATICAKDDETCDSIPPGTCGPDCHGFERKYK